MDVGVGVGGVEKKEGAREGNLVVGMCAGMIARGGG